MLDLSGTTTVYLACGVTDFLFSECLIFLVFMWFFLYNNGMNTNDLEPIFTDEQLHKMSKELEFINALLPDRLSIAQRKCFGSSSEKYSDGYEQLNLFNEAEEAADLDAGAPAMEEICPKAYKRKKHKGKKEQDLSAYPVTEIIHYTLEGEDGACPECGTPMKEVITESTKTLKFIPAHFEVLEEVVHVYSCPKCSAMERAQKPETQNWMWVYMLDSNSDGSRMVLFQYERARGGYHPKEFLDETLPKRR